MIRRMMDASAGYRMKGYHVEALAVEAFTGYQGRLSRADMLIHLCRTAADRVRAPIPETTGQSDYVDPHLGSACS